jgi:adenylate cyclase
MKNVEIERKFLVTNVEAAIENAIKIEEITQCYVAKDENTVVRVRNSNGIFYMTIKGKPKDSNLSRPEFEFEIDSELGISLTSTLGRGVVGKTRYSVEFDKMIWEVDIFRFCSLGKIESFVMAECECSTEEEAMRITLPEWVGKEVTEDIRYSNVSIGFNGVPNEN